MRGWSDLGLKEAGIQLVSTKDVMLDEELPNMGDIPLGIVSTGSYSAAATRPQNKAFLAAWHGAYGEKAIPDFAAVGGWDAMTAIFDMLNATGGKFTADEAMAFFKNWKNPDSPRGPIMIDPETRDIIQNVYLRRVEKGDGPPAHGGVGALPHGKGPREPPEPPTDAEGRRPLSRVPPLRRRP